MNNWIPLVLPYSLETKNKSSKAFRGRFDEIDVTVLLIQTPRGAARGSRTKTVPDSKVKNNNNKIKQHWFDGKLNSLSFDGAMNNNNNHKNLLIRPLGDTSGSQQGAPRRQDTAGRV